MTARELLEQAEELRRNCRFGEAINLYRAAAEAPDASEEIKRKSLASVELMQEINGFVNVEDRKSTRLNSSHSVSSRMPSSA